MEIWKEWFSISSQVYCLQAKKPSVQQSGLARYGTVSKMNFDEKEFLHISELGNLFRWNGVENVEQNVRVLGKADAKRVNDLALQSIDGFELDRAYFNQVSRCSSVDETIALKWLDELPIDPDESIVVCWSKSEVVITTWRFFAREWMSFCFPVMDDTIVLSLTRKWVLFYFHEEVLEFGLI